MAELFERHAALETRLADLADAMDRFNEGSPSPADRRLEGRLRRAEGEAGKRLATIEERIVMAPARSINAAILKLQVYAGLQGYDLAGGHRARGARPVEERLFSSILAELGRIAGREQSSDRKRSINARK